MRTIHESPESNYLILRYSDREKLSNEAEQPFSNVAEKKRKEENGSWLLVRMAA